MSSFCFGANRAPRSIHSSFANEFVHSFHVISLFSRENKNSQILAYARTDLCVRNYWIDESPIDEFCYFVLIVRICPFQRERFAMFPRCGSIARLVGHRTSITEVMASKVVIPLKPVCYTSLKFRKVDLISSPVDVFLVSCP